MTDAAILPAPNEPAALIDLDRDSDLAVVRRWQRDPVAFAAEALGVDLWDTQQAIARALRDFPRVAVRSCHAAGKTFLAGVAVLWFLYTRPGAVVLTTASTFRQVRYVLWRTVQRLHAAARLRLAGDLHQTELRLGDQWYGLGLTTDDPERFQGFHAPHVLVVVDEPGAVPPAVFAAIEGVLASGHTRLFMIGNPTRPQGPFFDAFHTEQHAYRTFQISAFATPNLQPGATPRPYLVSPQWVAERRRLWGQNSDLYRARVLAEFPHAGADQWFPRSLLDRALQPDAPPDAGTGRHALGVDVARFGPDATAFSHIREGVLVDQRQQRGLSTMETAGRVQAVLHDAPSLAVAIDDTGVGGGVTDRLREQGQEPQAEHFGAAARDARHYANRGSELYARLRSALEEERLRITPSLATREELLSQLTAITFDYTSDGRRRVRKRGAGATGDSPDLADSLALAWAAYDEGTEGPGLW